MRCDGLWMALGLGAALSLHGCVDSSGGGRQREAPSGVFGYVFDTHGEALPGSVVKVGDASATTQADGRFDLALAPSTHLVRAEAQGHLPQSRLVEVLPDAGSALVFRMMAEAPGVPLDASAGGQATGPRGATLTASPNAFVGPDDAPVTGEVMVHLTPLDPTLPQEALAAPGDYSALPVGGGDPVLLESFGMLDITVRQGGQALQIAPGAQVRATIPAVGSKPAQAGLWSFDEAQGRWVSEGELALDPQGQSYAADLPHLSYYNADIPMEVACVCGQVFDRRNRPVAGARVEVYGLDYAGTSYATSEYDGNFCLYVRISSRAQILVYHAFDPGSPELREIQTPDLPAPMPLPEDGGGCGWLGDWVVDTDQVRDDGGNNDGGNNGNNNNSNNDDRELCDTVEPALKDCARALSDLQACIGSQEGCVETVDLDTGARVLRFEGGGSIVLSQQGEQTQAEWFAPDGDKCGAQTTTPNDDGGATVEVTRADGQTTRVTARALGNDKLSLKCEDGQERDLSDPEAEYWRRCALPHESARGRCEEPPRDPCQSSADCQAPDVCCRYTQGAVCAKADDCPLERRDCADNDACPDGYVCCAGSDRVLGCRQAQLCVGCENDEQCAGRVCCDGECKDTPTCDGECSLDADCGGGEVCCGESPSTFCEDAVRCDQGKTCADSGACRGGLECCTQGAYAGQCQTTSECRRGMPCEADDECAGNLCCTFPGGQSACAGAEECGAATVCTRDEECERFEGLECCQRLGVCARPSVCALGQSCEDDSDCPGLTCCSIPELGINDVCQYAELCQGLYPCQTEADCPQELPCCAGGQFCAPQAACL